ncbi:MAG: hypothetical protein AAB575_01700 [Patescibacteria group bacterium]
MEQLIQKKSWYKIDSREDAIKIIKKSSSFFLCIAAIQIVVGLLAGISVLITGVIFLILGILLRKYNNTIIAVLLLFLSALAIIATVTNVVGGSQGGTSVLFAILLFFTSIGALRATLAYNKLK